MVRLRDRHAETVRRVDPRPRDSHAADEAHAHATRTQAELDAQHPLAVDEDLFGVGGHAPPTGAWQGAALGVARLVLTRRELLLMILLLLAASVALVEPAASRRRWRARRCGRRARSRQRARAGAGDCTERAALWLHTVAESMVWE